MLRHRASLVAFLLVVLSTGCMGLAQNPSYFPYYLPSGDIIRTHAKPPGVGYFQDFDRRAHRLEVTPTTSTNPTRTQVVLIATVYDREGDARRKRRVEWMLDGPGNIVEVDESGFTAGRGYKVDNKYAVSYTDFIAHTITRGNDDPRDDFDVRPGQTWCVVTSPVEGETTVTIYAPGIHDWDKGRVYTKLVWRDGDFRADPTPRGGRTDDALPLPDITRSNDSRRDPMLVGRSNGPIAPQISLDVKAPRGVALDRESPITIQLANVGRADTQAITVRTTLPEGVEYVSADPTPTRQFSKSLTWSLDPMGVNQNRELRVVVRARNAGVNSFTVVAESTDGLRGEKKVELRAGSSKLQVQATAPSTATTGERVPITVTLTNAGSMPAENAVVWVDTSGGWSARESEVRVGTIGANDTRTVTIPLTVERSGPAAAKLTVTADGGISERAEVRTTAGKAELDVNVNGSETITIGQDNLVEVRVQNRGDAPLANVVAKVDIPREFVIAAAGNGRANGNVVEWNLGALAAGEQKSVRVNTTATRMGERLKILAAAEGELGSGSRLPATRATGLVSVVGQPVLELQVESPSGTVAVNGRVQYRVTVRNRGNSSARSLELIATATPELRIVRAGDPSRRGGRVSNDRVEFDAVSELRAGESLVFVIECDAVQVGNARLTAEVRSREITQPVREEQPTRIAKR